MSIQNPYFIVNPKAGSGKSERLWPLFLSHIEKIWGKPHFVFTRKSGDAIHHAKLACEKGHRFIVSVGGDGTLHEVVNGLLQAKGLSLPSLKLGIISLGSGDDFMKSLNLPSDPLRALQLLANPKIKKIDVVQVDYVNHAHKKESRYFINLADFGWGGRVMQKVNASRKPLGSQLTYLFHGLSTLFTFCPFSVVLETPDKNYHFHKMLIGLVANGKYFGSGMCVAPEAQVDDGLLELIMVEKMGVLNFLSMLPQIYRGEKVENKNIFRLKVKKFCVQPTSTRPVFLELDGEQPGCLPASFEVLPRVLKVCV